VIVEQPARAAAPAISGIGGVVFEVKDLESARAFYEELFFGAQGGWENTSKSLTYRTGSQSVELVAARHPRTNADAGRHVAIRVGTGRVGAVAERLAKAGHEVSWWREDHPAERAMTAYVTDPSGNIVQLVGADPADVLIDHVGVPVENIEDAEAFYLKGLGGKLDGYFGWTTEHVIEARAWTAGDDPCAPWTRSAYISFRTHKPAPSPAAQIFAGFGPSYVAIYLTGKRLPEPPEEILRGTPRLILQTCAAPDDASSHLASARASAVRLTYDGGQIPFERDGRDLYFRDRSGHFLQLACAE
jgi:catechol 2,3-dioxygenase-like lactoylglutathione lyase family enzyme